MRTPRLTRTTALVLMLCLSSFACDEDDVVKEHFAGFGLNQLAMPTTGIWPGAVFVSSNNLPAYLDNMLNDTPEINGVPISVDSLPEYSTVIASLKDETKVSSDLALGFLSNVLPIAASLTISTDVSISPIDAKYKAFTVQTLIDYLASSSSEHFRENVDSYYQTFDDPEIFIAYEVYTAKQLEIEAEAGVDVSVGMPEDEVAYEVGYSHEKTSESVLVLNGDLSHAFAVRAALIEPDPNTSTTPRQYLVRDPQFTIDDDRVVITEQRASAIRYSASVVGDAFEPLELVPARDLLPPAGQ